MENKADDREYRNCIDEIKGDCPYMVRNSYGVSTCSIDHVVQVDFYGCAPNVTLNKSVREGK